MYESPGGFILDIEYDLKSLGWVLGYFSFPKLSDDASDASVAEWSSQLCLFLQYASVCFLIVFNGGES